MMKTWRKLIIGKYAQHFLLLSFFCFVQCASEKIALVENEVDQSAGDLLCVKVITPAATYYLEKEGAGLSSMLDRDGTDWIGFNKKPGTGSAGEYRGFPNAVHQQDGSFFHPLNAGTERSETEVLRQGEDHVRVKAISGNGNWEGYWDFYPTHCTFTMTRMPSDFKYWILYEGVPGGSYDDSDWYMTSASEEKFPMTTDHNGDIPGPEWIAFGDRHSQRSLLLVHHEDDDHIDRFYQMRREMTVFGFGREGLQKFLDKVPQRFSIAFIESTEHQAISEAVDKILSNANDLPD